MHGRKVQMFSTLFEESRGAEDNKKSYLFELKKFLKCAKRIMD